MTITKSGSLASFYTVNKAPIKHLRVYFSPKQAGSGDPSPENVREISGWNGIEVTHCSKNLYNPANVIMNQELYPAGDLYSTGTSNNWCVSDYMPVKPNTTYIATALLTKGSGRYALYDENKNYIRGAQEKSGANAQTIITTNANARYVRLTIRIGDKLNTIFEESVQENAYTYYPGQFHSLDWSNDIGTIYGGYVDLVTGKLVEEWSGSKTLDGSDDTSSPNRVKILMQYPDIDVFGAGRTFSKKVDDALSTVYCDSLPIMTEFTSNNFPYLYLNDNGTSIGYIVVIGKLSEHSELTTDSEKLQFVSDWLKEHNVTIYWKSTPIIHQLTSTQLQTLIGRNNIWSNADRVEVEYDLAESNDELYRRRNIILSGYPHIVTPEPVALQHFSTDMVAPLKECKIHFSPVQEGTGNPSPDNVREIVGWNGLTISRNNLFGTLKETNKTLNSTGDIISETGMVVTDYIPVISGDVYTYRMVATKTEARTRRIIGYNENKVFVDQLNSFNWMNEGQIGQATIIIPTGVYYIRICQYGVDTEVNLSKLEDIISISWENQIGTIYGGTIDLLNGKLIEDATPGGYPYKSIILNGTEEWTIVKQDDTSTIFKYYYGEGARGEGHSICSHFALKLPCYNALNCLNGFVHGMSGNLFIQPLNTIASTIEGFRTYLSEQYNNGTPVIVLYQSRTLLEHSITPTQLQTLRGTNNIWSNANGPIDIKYWTH